MTTLRTSRTAGSVTILLVPRHVELAELVAARAALRLFHDRSLAARQLDRPLRPAGHRDAVRAMRRGEPADAEDGGARAAGRDLEVARVVVGRPQADRAAEDPLHA